MKDLSVRFANLFDKVETLLVKYARSRDELLRLRKENEELRQHQAERDDKIRELNDKIALLRTAREIGKEGEDRSVIRQKVNEYIKEIDRCIALLNG
jgi:uncharacterized protein YydD (DUF2326 family)